MMRLTEKQKSVYDFIISYLCENHRAPTRSEISEEMGFSSQNSAQEYLAILEKKGYISFLAGNRNIYLNNVRLEVINLR